MIRFPMPLTDSRLVLTSEDFRILYLSNKSLQSPRLELRSIGRYKELHRVLDFLTFPTHTAKKMAPGIEIQYQHDGTRLDTHWKFSKSTSSTKPTSSNTHHLASSTTVLNPAFITRDFDKLRFEAAAFNQLPRLLSSSPPLATDADVSSSPALSTSLISSPYNDPGHYLDLRTLSIPSLLLAKALTALQPTTPDYATAAYTDALNFDHVLGVLQSLARSLDFKWKETHFYVVVFRSRLNAGVDQDWLYKLDYESHREACESGGLLKYWFGKADAERRNLATCE